MYVLSSETVQIVTGVYSIGASTTPSSGLLLTESDAKPIDGWPTEPDLSPMFSSDVMS
jgi:hypothetical protein